MRFVSQLFHGLRAYMSSFGTLRRARLRYLYGVSALFTLLFTLIGAWAIQWAMDAIGAWYDETWPPENTEELIGLQAFWTAIQAGGRVLVRAIVFVALWWLKMKLLKYIVIVFLGPVMAWASEQVEAHLTGDERPFDWRTWWREFIRGLRSAMLLFVWEMSLTALLLMLTAAVTLFTGGLGVLLSPLLTIVAFLLGAWFYGASVLDFVWERRGMGARMGLRQTATNHGLAIGLGLPFAIWMVIPFVGWILAPIIAPVTSAAAAVIAIAQSKGSTGSF